MRFKCAVELNGKTATGIEIPEPIVSRLGSKRPTARVTINGYSFTITVGSMGGRYMIPLSADNRSKAGVAAGQKIDVDIEPDTQARTVSVPVDLARALSRENKAKSFFESLPYSHQKAYVAWIESAKKSETRERRVSDAVAMLAEKRKR